MSAFVVDHAHIDALITFAVLHRVGEWQGEQVTHSNATEVGRMLLAENVRSVKHRYPDCTDDDLPGAIGETVEGYEFRMSPKVVHGRPLDKAVLILKACDCFDYQACETDDYRETKAAKLIDRIRYKAINALPGYDNAPWGISREKNEATIIPLSSLMK